MTAYLFTINLLTEDATPPFQISILDSLLGAPIYNLPPNKMPPNFEMGDTIQFWLAGKLIFDCKLYIRPILGSDSPIGSSSPPYLVKYVHELRVMDPPWQVTLWGPDEFNHDYFAMVEFITLNAVGYWDFQIAGTFAATLFTNSVPNAFVPMPFLVDPECVVGAPKST